MADVKGGIIVHSRTILYTFEAGGDKVTYLYTSATYTGDVSGTVHEPFVKVDHADGTQSHYGNGAFVGNVAGREGELLWKFKGKPGSGDIEIFDGSGEIGALRGGMHYRLDGDSTEKSIYAGSLE